MNGKNLSGHLIREYRKSLKQNSKFEEQYFFLNTVKNRFQKTRHSQLQFSQRTSNISEKWPFPQKSLQRENHLQLLTDAYVNGIFRCFSTPLGHIIVHISSTFPAKQNRLWQQFCMPYTLKYRDSILVLGSLTSNIYLPLE